MNLSVTAVVYRARFKITQSIDHSHEGLYLQCVGKGDALKTGKNSLKRIANSLVVQKAFMVVSIKLDEPRQPRGCGTRARVEQQVLASDLYIF